MESQDHSFDLILNRKHFSKIGFCYLLGTLIILVAQFGIIKIIYHFSQDFAKDNQFLIMMLSMYLIAMPLFFFMITRIKKKTVIEKKSIKIHQLLGYFVVCYAVMYLSNIFSNILIQIISAIKHGSVVNALSDAVSSNHIFVNIFIIVICAPIMEELLFRKLLIDRVLQYGDKIAIFLSGFMFGLYHGNLYQFFYAFALGCIFAYIYIKYGRIIYTMILHVIINFIGSVVTSYITKVSGILDFIEKFSNPDMMSSNQEIVQLFADVDLGGFFIFILYFLIVITCVLTGIVLFAVHAKKIVFEKGEIQVPKGYVFKTVYFNYGMGFFILFWLGYILFATVI